MSSHDFALPADLPRPTDDGACAHLPGMPVPPLTFSSTSGEPASIVAVPDRLVLYVYPMTGRPGVSLPDGWDLIPGARGCTPEACAFRDHQAELTAAGATVMGLSSQSTEYQREVVSRLHLPFPLLSDPDMVLAQEFGLPTFSVDDRLLYSRLTLVIRNSVVEHVFYPVFPPDAHAAEVLAWLNTRSRGGEFGG
ncbi:MAG TPA: peroxiredoxin [Actinomycetes bacterium]|nr:peroxiredoxin [Actinomycetes bacterium]